MRFISLMFTEIKIRSMRLMITFRDFGKHSFPQREEWKMMKDVTARF